MTQTTSASELIAGRWGAIGGAANRPIDIASLAFFRGAFGGLMAWEMWRYLDPGHDWIVAYYYEPSFLFKYAFFGWVHPLPEPSLYVVFAVIGLAAMGVGVGLFYRVSAVTLFVGLTYVFLLARSRYLNHWYLMILVAMLLVFMPAAQAYSLDAWRGRASGEQRVAAWTLCLTRFQIGIVYFYGGVAKINGDWLSGEPVSAWLGARQDFPLVGSTFASPAVGTGLGYAAMVFDLTVVPLLLWKRTRPYAFIAAIMFNLANARLFSIGVFPWLMLAATMLFFDADWPRRVAADVRRLNVRGVVFLVSAAAGALVGAMLPSTFALVPMVVAGLGFGVAGHQVAASFVAPAPIPDTSRGDSGPAALSTVGLVLLLAYVSIQILVPLRHFAIPGNVHWTEEGHRFSWHMKLRDKQSYGTFTVVEVSSGRRAVIDPSAILTYRQAGKYASRPDMVVQFAHHIESRYAPGASGDVVVLFDGWSTLNGRHYQRLVDPEFDLTSATSPWFPPAEWIVPLHEPRR